MLAGAFFRELQYFSCPRQGHDFNIMYQYYIFRDMTIHSWTMLVHEICGVSFMHFVCLLAIGTILRSQKSFSSRSVEMSLHGFSQVYQDIERQLFAQQFHVPLSFLPCFEWHDQIFTLFNLREPTFLNESMYRNTSVMRCAPKPSRLKQRKNLFIISDKSYQKFILFGPERCSFYQQNSITSLYTIV